MKTIALGIPHCGWDAQRVKMLTRLVGEMGQSPDTVRMVFSEPGPAHSSVWSEKLWEWWEASGADYCLTIQDDARVAPNFWGCLRAMLEAVPNEVIGLQAIHPAGPALAEVGKYRWYTTRDMLAGVSYVMPRAVVAAFNMWRRCALRPGTAQRLNEDNIVALFCVDHGIRIWHPLPTLVDHHDPAELVPSNYGHGSHGNRNGTWTWLNEMPSDDPEWWRPEAGGVPHLGRFYQHTPWHLARNVHDWAEEEMRDLENDLVGKVVIRDRR
jgi:hypothetical protein